MEERLRFVCRVAGRVSVAGGRALVLDEILKGDECDLASGRSGAQNGEPMQVSSEKISSPERAGVVNMVDVVPPIVGRCLVTAGAFELGEEELPATWPGMCSKVDADEWQKLLMRMTACRFCGVVSRRSRWKVISRLIQCATRPPSVTSPGSPTRVQCTVRPAFNAKRGGSKTPPLFLMFGQTFQGADHAAILR